MVVSLTIIPVLAARFLGRRPMPTTGPIYNLLADGYERALKVGLRFPKTVMLLALLAVVPGWWLFQHLETGFMPDMDEGAFVLDYNMPVGTSLAQTDKVMRRVEDVLLRHARHLRLHPPDGRRARLLRHRAVHRRHPGQPQARRPAPAGRASCSTRSARSSRPRSPSWRPSSCRWCRTRSTTWRASTAPSRSRSSAPTSRRSARWPSRSARSSRRSRARPTSMPHVYLGNPDIVVRPDSVQTARVGLTEMDVESQLNAALYGQVASTVPEQDRMTKIRVRYPDRVRYDRDHLALLPISLATATPATGGASLATAAGVGFVPLGQLATIRTVRSPNELWRENQQPVITVTAELEDRDLGSVNRELQAKLAELKFPPGYRWELAGSYRAQQESFASLLTVLIVAAALVFLLLGFQFRSLTLPLLIFLAQPISLASALFALWITGTPLNVSSFMGAILLIGLDVKNGIILIEYIGQLRAEGMPLHEALVQAGRTRFRPILMTSLCTILGLVPLALGMGPGAQMQQPLAIAVIGGLITNMLLTRLLIPVGYLVLVGRRGAAPS